jgi:hypothetical protein
MAEEMARPSVVERWISEHPELTLIPAKQMLKRGMVRTAGAAALRIPHPITRAIGAGIIAYEVGSEIYRNITNYSKGGKDAVTKGARGGGSGPGRVRIQNTPQEVKSYLKGLKEKGVLDSGRKCAGDHYAYKFTRDCEYKGIKFKKDQFVSEDTRHHEIEWFRNKDYHLGSVEPKGGTMYKAGKGAERILKF